MSIKNSRSALLDDTRNILRRLHYSIHIERAYCDWISRFVRFHHLQERTTLLLDAKNKVEAFLTHLAVQANVAFSKKGAYTK